MQLADIWIWFESWVCFIDAADSSKKGDISPVLWIGLIIKWDKSIKAFSIMQCTSTALLLYMRVLWLKHVLKVLMSDFHTSSPTSCNYSHKRNKYFVGLIFFKFSWSWAHLLNFISFSSARWRKSLNLYSFGWLLLYYILKRSHSIVF